MGHNFPFIWWVQFSSVQLLSYVWLFATPWTAAHKASPSITNSWSLLKLMSIESVMPSSAVPFSSCLQSFPAPGSFPRSQFFASVGQSVGVSALAPVLLMNIQDWFPQQSCVKEEENWRRLFSNLYWFYIWTSSKILLVCKLKDSKDCKCLIALYIIVGLYVQKIIRNKESILLHPVCEQTINKQNLKYNTWEFFLSACSIYSEYNMSDN